MEFYKELRDSTFTKQYIYKLHIQIKTLESKVIETDIYEKIVISIVYQEMFILLLTKI